jgi:TonB family protein
MSSNVPNLGNPAAPALPTMAMSNGTGSGGGIGSGAGGGVGKGTGPGVGEGHGGGVGGGAYHVGGSVLAPRALSTPDPEYTEQAREAKLQGLCVLRVIVGADGKPRDIHVIRSLGMGLDEKAIAAVSQWAFSPATKDGLPVPVQISVQVTFRLN